MAAVDSSQGGRKQNSESSSDESMVDPIEVLKSRIRMCLGNKFDDFTGTHHETIATFVSNPKTIGLFAFIQNPLETGDGKATLEITDTLPAEDKSISRVAYTLKTAKKPTNYNDDPEMIFSHTSHGVVHNPFLESMLAKVQELYAPTFFDSECWPDSIRNDFNSHLHRYLALITDQKHRIRGKTVIYVPKEGLHLKADVAARDKEFVSRLENAMIHWTRQIKDVLNAQDTNVVGSSDGKNVGPLQEIEFWSNRCKDLSGLSEQLNHPDVIKIQKVLEHAKSSYVTQFKKLSKQITQGNKQAQSNLKYLTVLDKPCTKLAKSKPAEVIEQIDEMIMYIRFIWVNSEFYNTRERLTSLFRKLSNEIIRICSANIDLKKVFSGYVFSTRSDIKDCMAACSHWKSRYKFAQKVHHEFSQHAWVLDESSIFAQVDAFIQRCNDLLEVLECQEHFGRWEDGTKTKMPIFMGSRAPEMVRSLQEIEKSFQKHLLELSTAEDAILDVKNSQWHDYFNKFRVSIKDLEVMVQILLTAAFDSHNTIMNYVHVLEIFEHFSVRESIRRELDKKTKYIWFQFTEEVNCVKRLLAAKKPFLNPNQPKYAGAAQWARLLKRRVERPMELLKKADLFLPKTGSGEEAKASYNNLIQALEEFVRQTFAEWSSTVRRDVVNKLDQPLMIRSPVQPELLDVNFDPTLLKLFAEIYHWERLMFEIPHFAAEIYLKRDELRMLKEHVLLVVRDYNKIITALNADERQLFKERIRGLDKKIIPGLTKLTWATKGISDFFVNECRNYASRIMSTVLEFKAAGKEIARKCLKISNLLLVNIDSKHPYKSLEFGDIQQKHREKVQTEIAKHYDDIIEYLMKISANFARDGPEVYQRWVTYVDKIDNHIEEAIKINLKNSLQELQLAIHGDGKVPPAPLFKVEVILENRQHLNSGTSFVPDQIAFLPNLDDLSDLVSNLTYNLSDAFKGLPRLTTISQLVKQKTTSKPDYVDVVDTDDDINKQRRYVNEGMMNMRQDLQEYLSETEKEYNYIFSNDKEAFIRRYEKLNPEVGRFSGDISRFNESINNIQTIESIISLNFIMLDSGLLKNSLIAHCQQWISKFQSLLKRVAIAEYKSLIQYLTTNAEKVVVIPQTLEELGDSVGLYKQLEHDRTETYEKINPIIERFKVLDSYDVPIDEDIDVEILGPYWIEFDQALLTADQMLKKNKEKFKSNLLASADEFKRNACGLVENFRDEGPYISTITVEAAMESIQNYHDQIKDLQKQHTSITRGLAIFNIEQGASKELSGLNEDLEYLTRAWNHTKQWNSMWEEWKVGDFVSLVTDQMELKAQELYKQLNRLGREVKDKNWKILDDTKSKIQQFQRTMPLITDLKNPAMRDRHWRQVKTEVSQGKADPDTLFDEKSSDFTLGVIIELGMDSFSETICEVSGAASKELSIEEGLNEIAEQWENQTLIITPYKDRGHHIMKLTDEINQLLDDNQVTLATMKGSRYVKAFEKIVDYWERTLSHIMETLEMIMQVQRQWLYLENIFIGEDIRKQLPQETLKFDEVNSYWKQIMDKINKDPNAKRATSEEGLLERLNTMNTELEEIQKSLDMYLETKRQIFPRFYFLSNDDLLEILGQAKNPELIQPHLKKCFDNIKQLHILSISAKKYAAAMISCEDEEVPFKDVQKGIDVSYVLLEGPVEGWLCDVERHMQWALLQYLKKCRIDLKKKLLERFFNYISIRVKQASFYSSAALTFTWESPLSLVATFFLIFLTPSST